MSKKKEKKKAQTITSIVHIKYMHSVFVNLTETQMFAVPATIEIL